MRTIEVVELLSAGIATLLLGLIVAYRNFRQGALRWFFVMCLAVSFWSWGIALYILTGNAGRALFWANFYYISAFAIGVAAQVFAYYWLRGKTRISKTWHVILSSTCLAMFTALLFYYPHLIISSLSVFGGQKSVVLNTGGYAVFNVLFLLMFGDAVFRFFRIAGDEHGLYESQSRYIAVSLISAGIFGSFFNLILPWFGYYSLVWAGPFSAMIFTAFVYYGIAREKLFDIRMFILRALGYVFTTILLSLVYVMPAIVGLYVVMHVPLTWPHFIWGVALAAVIASFYGRAQSAFNNITNKIFYRGYYEPQDILNQLSEVLVRSIEVEYIQRQSTNILNRAIRADRIGYWLVTDADYEQRSPEKLARLFHGAAYRNVVITDELPENSACLEHLKQEGVAAIVRLRTGSAGMGFLVLGFKESGAAYSEHDKQLLHIASDEIAIALQNALHFREIRHFNETLKDRVAQATRELRRSNDKLRSLDVSKDDFISMASHQLRTPLTSVKGYLSMVLEGDAGEITPMQKEMLSQAFFSSQRMVYIIADLLNVSRLKTGKFIIDPRNVNLAELIEEELVQVEEMAASKQLTLQYDKPKDFPELMLDDTKIRQVVMNFVDNAIYYTPSGGRITVRLLNHPSTVELRIEDNGMGVPKSEQPHLFTKFYRAGNARKARPDGTGLGLFMAKKVIIAQGGSVVFESQEGKGSCFGFMFSKSRLAPKTSSKPADGTKALAGTRASK